MCDKMLNQIFDTFNIIKKAVTYAIFLVECVFSNLDTVNILYIVCSTVYSENDIQSPKMFLFADFKYYFINS